MPKPPLIALLTDFGLQDPFVGVMKGVIATICRSAQVIDLTHSVSSQNVREGAFHLDRSSGYFPEGTVFACIVDPGVGTLRRAIALQAGPYRFVAPDNGLLTPVFDRFPDARCHALTDTRFHLPNRSATFHGRDIFSPVAAHLAAGVPVEDLGPEVELSTCARITMFRNDQLENGTGWKGEVVSIDHFGNIITSFDASMIEGDPSWHLSAGTSGSLPILRTYGEVEPGMPLAYIGSSGMIEIAIRNGNASRIFGIGEEDQVWMKRGVTRDWGMGTTRDS
ncbi:MAG: SAM-dependent chlorinase/fluorinase [Chlorobiaceae bacterium]|nr:SAM-dependent chlorinase/fluorinase [Chlorobiaceae bacterium]